MPTVSIHPCFTQQSLIRTTVRGLFLTLFLTMVTPPWRTLQFMYDID